MTNLFQRGGRTVVEHFSVSFGIVLSSGLLFFFTALMWSPHRTEKCIVFVCSKVHEHKTTLQTVTGKPLPNIEREQSKTFHLLFNFPPEPEGFVGHFRPSAWIWWVSVELNRIPLERVAFTSP